MNKFKKIIGYVLILITVIWSWYLLWSAFYDSIRFPRGGFSLVSVFLVVLLLVLVLPVGVSYIFSKNELQKAGRVAVWFHFSSIVVLILGLLPYFLVCIIHISYCDKGGVGELILFGISALMAGVLYIIGLVALSINKGSRTSSENL
jgi:membrane protease YdiL (CAAX protease family)